MLKKNHNSFKKIQNVTQLFVFLPRKYQISCQKITLKRIYVCKIISILMLLKKENKKSESNAN